jgi:hypothetical protein
MTPLNHILNLFLILHENSIPKSNWLPLFLAWTNTLVLPKNTPTIVSKGKNQGPS